MGKTILLTGGTGAIGQPLRIRLEAAGHRVLAPARSALDLEGPYEGWRLPPKCDVLVHAAASRSRAQPGPERWPVEVGVNVEATARLWEWARQAEVPAVMFVSTLSVVAHTIDLAAPLDETSNLVRAPGHPYALTKRWAEELVRSCSPGFQVTAIVRPSLTYGPGFGVRHRWAEQLRAGEPFAVAGERGHRYSPVHVDDVVDVIARWVMAPTSTTMHVAGPDARFECDLIRALADTLGLEPNFTTSDEAPLSLASVSRVADALYPDRLRTPWPG